MAGEIPCPWVVQRRPRPGLPPLFFARGRDGSPVWISCAEDAMRFSTSAFGEGLVGAVTPEACAAVPLEDRSRWL